MPPLSHFFVFSSCFWYFSPLKATGGERGNSMAFCDNNTKRIATHRPLSFRTITLNVAIVAIRWCLKQIIKYHFVLGNARIHVALKTITADKRQLYGLPSFRFFHKTGNFVSQNLIIILIDGKLSFREFHFA